MGVRDQVVRTRYRNVRRKSRRDLITRTARVWTRLYKHLVPDLKEIAHKWVIRLLKQATGEVSSGYIANLPELPSKFTEKLENTLREAYAYGYWLNHLYVQGLKAAKAGKSYNGRVSLSDMPVEEELRRLLKGFISLEASEDWQEVIPQDSIDWLNGYVPSLAGNLSNSVLERVNEVIRVSMLEGKSLQERMKDLRKVSPELSQMTDTRIEAIARTEITRADTLGRLVSMKNNPDVIGVEFSAILDDRTTAICSERHGLVMRLDDPRLPENTPPCHVNCRSMLLSCTIYDYPDGLLTSHEFEELRASTNRPEDIEEVQKILASEKTVEGIAEVSRMEPEGKKIVGGTEEVPMKANIPAEITPSKVYEALTDFYTRTADLVRGYASLNEADKHLVQEDMKRLLIEVLGGLISPEVMEIIGLLLGE